METFVCIYSATAAFFAGLGHKISSVSDDAREASFLLIQRVSINIQHSSLTRKQIVLAYT